MTESYAATLPMVAVPRLALAALRELRRLVQLVSQQHAQGRQLNLLVLARRNTRYQRLDAVARAEVTGLLKLLLDECSAALAKATEAADE